jgi:hypothetical protein
MDRLFLPSVSTLAFTVSTFSSPRLSATEDATFIFFPMESHKVKLQRGKATARGIPGNPPPVPTSRMLLPAGKSTTFAIARL